MAGVGAFDIGAIDIGGTKIAVGVVDENGRVLARRECPTAAGRGYRDALARVGSMLREAMRESGRSIQGIGSTGPWVSEERQSVSLCVQQATS